LLLLSGGLMLLAGLALVLSTRLALVIAAVEVGALSS